MKLITFIAGIQAQPGKSYLPPYSKPWSPWQYDFKQGRRQKKTTPVKYTYNSPLPFYYSLFFLESVAYMKAWWATRICSNYFPWPLYKRTGGGETLGFLQPTHPYGDKTRAWPFHRHRAGCTPSAQPKDPALPPCQRPRLPPHALSASSATGRRLKSRG